MRGSRSLNHDFVLEFVKRSLAGKAGGRGLDFGCGHGMLVSLARNEGLAVDGCDTFEGPYTSWQQQIVDGAKSHIARIQSGRIPYPDDAFDVVVSNQVFEHVPPEHLEQAFNEIARVLKPGGRFLALFPPRETWFEGHLGLYFVHRLDNWPSLQQRYSQACHRLGFGYYRQPSETSADWAQRFGEKLKTEIFYHTTARCHALISEAFGSAPQSLAADYLRFRLARSTNNTFRRISMQRQLDPFYSWICLKRAGVVLSATKTPSH